MTESADKHDDVARLAATVSTGSGADEHDGPGAGDVAGGGLDGTIRAARGSAASRRRSPSIQGRCRGTTKSGAPCQAPATMGGYCVAHSGKHDMAELGRRGGLSRETELRKAARTDAEIIEKAKGALVDQLDGKDEKRRFEAAKALFSFRPQAPPQEHEQHERERLLTRKGRPVVGLADLLELATDEVQGMLDSARMQEVILRAAAKVRELQAAGVRVDEQTEARTPSPR